MAPLLREDEIQISGWCNGGDTQEMLGVTDARRAIVSDLAVEMRRH
jgi:hypothetical protein